MSVRLFGKLPTHGDFIAYGLSAEERARWDAWLASTLDEAKHMLGEDFADRFDAAPPWCFAAAGLAGALAPSQDRAGRRFPVLLAVAADPASAGGAAAACEMLLYDAIVERQSADDLIARAAALAPEPLAMPGEGWWRPGAATVTLLGAEPPALLMAMLVATETV